MPKPNETPASLAPSATSKADKRRRFEVRQGTLIVVVGIVALAFALYTFIVLYGILTSG